MTPKIAFTSRGASISFGSAAVPPPTVSDVALPATSLPVVEAPAARGAIEWAGHYRIETHGKSDDEILAEINRVQIHHDKKSARLEGFRAFIGGTFDLAGQLCTIADVTLGERGTDVEIRVAAVDEAGSRTTITRIYNSIDDIPRNSEIVGMLAAAVTDKKQAAAHEAAEITRLQTLFGQGG